MIPEESAVIAAAIAERRAEMELSADRVSLRQWESLRRRRRDAVDALRTAYSRQERGDIAALNRRVADRGLARDRRS